jgi:hypothetical protein
MARRIASKQVAAGVLAILALVGVAAAFALKRSRSTHTNSAPPSSNSQTTPGQPVTEEPASPSTPPNSPASPPPSQPIGQPPPKPTLQKSSSVVPPGALVNFVCEGTINLMCDVILTNKSTAQKLSLGAKAIADNGRGQYFASWNWESQAGDWSVVARVTSAGGASTDSDPQEVTVK